MSLDFQPARVFKTFCAHLLICWASVASAAIVAHDGFESYTAGSNLNAGGGGSGWTGNWSTLDGHTTVQSFTLTDPTGNVSSGSQSARLRATANLADVGNHMSRSFGAQTGTIYVSFLIRVDETVGDVDNADFYNFQASDGATGNNSAMLGVGLRNTAGNPFFARAGSSSNSSVDSTTLGAPNTTFLLVAKFSKDGLSTYNRTDLFINPTGPLEPDTANATATFNTGLNQLSLFSVRNFQPEQDDTVFIDELRITTTFAEAIPETNTLLLGGLSVLLLMRRRR